MLQNNTLYAIIDTGTGWVHEESIAMIPENCWKRAWTQSVLHGVTWINLEQYIEHEKKMGKDVFPITISKREVHNGA